MRYGVAALAAGVIVVHLPIEAAGQAVTHSPVRVDTATHAIIDQGRDRMRRGDCAGALDLFDQALASSMDPTVRRDRGLCHERLGHTYPAIEDYRAYLTATPDAPDADGIRDRLQLLTEDASGSAPAHPSANDDIPPSSSGPYSPDPPMEATQPQASDESDVPASSLRNQTGFGLAPIFVERKWIRDRKAFGDGETWAEIPGIELRYSVAAHGAVVLDVGYEQLDSSSADAERASGFESQLSYELRVPLDLRYDNQLTFTPGAGYDYLVYSPSLTTLPGYSEGVLSGRARLGYRHMLASSTSLDLGVEGGIAWFLKLANADVDSHASIGGFAGLVLGVTWGF